MLACLHYATQPSPLSSTHSFASAAGAFSFGARVPMQADIARHAHRAQGHESPAQISMCTAMLQRDALYTCFSRVVTILLRPCRPAGSAARAGDAAMHTMQNQACRSCSPFSRRVLPALLLLHAARPPCNWGAESRGTFSPGHKRQAFAWTRQLPVPTGKGQTAACSVQLRGHRRRATAQQPRALRSMAKRRTVLQK